MRRCQTAPVDTCSDLAQITTAVRRADTRPPVRLCIHHPPPYPHTGHHFRGTSSTFRSFGGLPCHANKSIVLMLLNQPGMLRQLSSITLCRGASCIPATPCPTQGAQMQPDACCVSLTLCASSRILIAAVSHVVRPGYTLCCHLSSFFQRLRRARADFP